MTFGKVRIGKIQDAHGIQGELLVLVFSGDNSWVSKLKTLFLPQINAEGVCVLQERSVVRIRLHKKGFVCRLEGIQDRNQAESMVGTEVWVDEALFISKDGESLYLKEVFGFDVVDQRLGLIGPITGFSSNGSQDLLIVKRNDSSVVEIPFVKDFVQRILFSDRVMHMNLPEGLLEINHRE